MAEGGRTEPSSLSFFRRKSDEERPQPAPGLSVGKLVGDFRLLSLIGQGGMGQVWEAEQVSLRRRVAVKFVSPERVTAHQLAPRVPPAAALGLRIGPGRAVDAPSVAGVRLGARPARTIAP